MQTRDEILKRTGNGLEVFRHYIGGEWRVGRNFLNPLYEDRTSCNIWFDRHNGCYRIKDFGNDAYSSECFDIVGMIKGLNCGNPKDFIGILKATYHDLHLGLDEGSDASFSSSVSQKQVRRGDISMKSETSPKQNQPFQQPNNSLVPAPKKIKPYSTVQQSFSARETAFWAQYGITPEILKIYKVSSLQEFRSENSKGKPFSFYSTDSEPMFGYQGKRHVKIYRPNSEIRFLYGGSLPDNYCFGLEQLPAKGKTLFITGGEKDVMTLTAHSFYAI